MLFIYREFLKLQYLQYTAHMCVAEAEVIEPGLNGLF